MKIIFYYIRDISPVIAHVLLLVFIVNVVLATSSGIGMDFTDIIYLNILMATVSCLFGIIGCMRFCLKYSKLKKAVDNRENTDCFLPQDKSFNSTLIRDVTSLKNDECVRKTAVYQNSMDELNDYITKWVHEIKTPISICELILDNDDSGNFTVRRKIKLELARMKFLVNQVLYASKAANYGENLVVCEFSLGRAVKDAVKRNADFFITKDIEVFVGTIDFDVVNDEKWVSYILDQILNNASKYTCKNGRVEIYAKEDDKAVRLYIKDNGIGIGEGDISRIFDRGFIGKNAINTAKSTGMGLYYSKKIADLLGIGIGVSSEVGEYTEFVMVFYKMRDYFNVT